MQILGIGIKKKLRQGFSLIELLVVLVIFSITLSVMSLSFPRNDERVWRDVSHHLVVSLNEAKDESTLSNQAILFQIDEQGWRFFIENSEGKMDVLGDALEPFLWDKKTKVDGSASFYLDEVLPNKPKYFTITQGDFSTSIRQRPDGYFEIN
jgi:type II secretion system protein H